MCSNEAGRTETAPSVVTGTTIAARVVGEAVRLDTGATGVVRHTVAAITVHQVIAGAAVQTRVTGTFVYVGLTDLT